MSLSARDFDYICTLVRERSGMVLESGKEYLVETRLSPVARKAGYDSLNALISHLRDHKMNALHTSVVEALITNETQFFRDVHPFETLRNWILPELIEKQSNVRQLNLWCAAASTGQEPYSLMMLIDDVFPQLSDWSVRCIASDISEDVLEQARQGEFSDLEVKRGLPKRMLEKYFRPHGSKWKISDQIRRRVEFRCINLVSAWPPLPRMDAILLRNVLIYFNTETKQAILRRIRQTLKPDGYLMLGSVETTINVDPDFLQVTFDKTACYQIRKTR